MINMSKTRQIGIDRQERDFKRRTPVIISQSEEVRKVLLAKKYNRKKRVKQHNNRI